MAVVALADTAASLSMVFLQSPPILKRTVVTGETFVGNVSNVAGELPYCIEAAVAYSDCACPSIGIIGGRLSTAIPPSLSGWSVGGKG
eukprot:11878617-Ditylum_brightwellii.AAC.1